MKRMVLLAIWVALLSAPALAHKLKVFASVEDDTVSGHAYLSGGGRAHQVPVQVLAPDGTELLRAVTDEQGRFSFNAPRRCDLRLVVDSGDGHRGEWIIRAAELPSDLTAWDGDEAAPAVVATRAASAPTGDAPMDSVRVLIREELGPLEARIARLAEDIESAREEIRLRDVLAGLGYLLGGAGLASWWMKKRARGST